jgi:hypothetical protein
MSKNYVSVIGNENLSQRILILIERLRREISVSKIKESLSVEHFLRIFYSENQAYAQHDRHGTVTIDIRANEVTIYNSLADEPDHNYLGFCIHYNNSLFCFDLNKEDPADKIKVFEVLHHEYVSANPQWYIGNEPPFKWNRDKNTLSMYGFSKYQHSFKQDPKNENRIIYQLKEIAII